MKLAHELIILFWQTICFRQEIERVVSVNASLFRDIYAKSIFSSYFITLREVIDLLIFVQTFIEVRFAGTAGP